MSDTKMVDVLMGPYRNQRLTMSAADAESAVNNHWATDPDAAPDDDHPPLSEAERTAAWEAANAWATTQWETAQGIEPDAPPPEGETGDVLGRDLEGGEPGKYTTRGAKPRARR